MRALGTAACAFIAALIVLILACMPSMYRQEEQKAEAERAANRPKWRAKKGSVPRLVIR